MRLTGILLVGGRSARYGSPKATARLGGESFAERAWQVLEASCDHVLAVGKTADELSLPFDVLDDGSDVRAPLAGVVAGLRAAPTDLCVVVPVDCVTMTSAAIEHLARACEGHAAAVSQTGPLPGCYRRSALPVLERRLAERALRLRDAAAELDAVTEPWRAADSAASPRRLYSR